MTRVRRPGTRSLPGFILLAALVAGVPASNAGAREACVTAQVPEAFTLPDGTSHPAGRITLCAVMAMSPATGVHRLWLDGEGASLVLSHRTIAETPPDSSPSLLFKRDARGVLDFVGFVVPDGRRAWTYALRRGVSRFATSSVALTAAH
jgi:hypothetical protein